MKFITQASNLEKSEPITKQLPIFSTKEIWTKKNQANQISLA
jgi:hypothetical protein